jgi:hypothetical protein
LNIHIPVNRRIGQHIVTVKLDENNSIDEIYENDNSAEYTFTVYSTSVRPLEVEKFYSARRDRIKVLNPVAGSNDTLLNIRVSISDNPLFNNASDIIENMDSVFTAIDLSTLQNNKRYWWRVKLNDAGQEWSDVFSFKNTDNDF